MVGVLLPFLKWFIGGSGSKGLKILNFLVRSPWSTIDIIGEIKQPILLLSGLQDEMIPPSHMQKLYAKAAARNNLCVFEERPSGIQQFLQEHVPQKREDHVPQEREDGLSFDVSGNTLTKSTENSYNTVQ